MKIDTKTISGLFFKLKKLSLKSRYRIGQMFNPQTASNRENRMNGTHPEVTHRYPKTVHIVDDPMAAVGLTDFCNQETAQSTLLGIVKSLYREVLLRRAVNDLFPRQKMVVSTPMVNVVGRRGILEAEVIDPATKVAIATVLRAGNIPSTVIFNRLAGILKHGSVRQDYFGASRVTDGEHRVTGTKVSYEKLGPLDGRILLLPDPMGATGGSMIQVLECYGRNEVAKAKAIATLHLIITPEYIGRVTEAFPDVHIYALRLDRGMSDTEVQESIPGTFPDRERGLTDTQYIAPGGGDIGFRLTGAE